MSKQKMIMTPLAQANFLVQFLEGDNAENREYAKQQILALCEFHAEHTADEAREDLGLEEEVN